MKKENERKNLQQLYKSLNYVNRILIKRMQILDPRTKKVSLGELIF